MKQPDPIIVKPTPVIFLRNLIIIEAAWAVASLLLSLQFSPTELYSEFQTGNASQPLTISQAVKYAQTHFNR